MDSIGKSFHNSSFKLVPGYDRTPVRYPSYPSTVHFSLGKRQGLSSQYARRERGAAASSMSSALSVPNRGRQNIFTLFDSMVGVGGQSPAGLSVGQQDGRSIASGLSLLTPRRDHLTYGEADRRGLLQSLSPSQSIPSSHMYSPMSMSMNNGFVINDYQKLWGNNKASPKAVTWCVIA